MTDVMPALPPRVSRRSAKPCVTVQNDLFGGVHIKIDEFVYVDIHYDANYTTPEKIDHLKDRIVTLIRRHKTEIR